jgi:hypothetical protein
MDDTEGPLSSSGGEGRGEEAVVLTSIQRFAESLDLQLP